MSDRKTPEERARDWVEAHMSWDRYECDWDGAGIETFLAGRADFIKNDLPELLKLAREGVGTEVEYNDYTYSYADLIAMAEKGEV